MRHGLAGPGKAASFGLRQRSGAGPPAPLADARVDVIGGAGTKDCVDSHDAVLATVLVAVDRRWGPKAGLVLALMLVLVLALVLVPVLLLVLVRVLVLAVEVAGGVGGTAGAAGAVRGGGCTGCVRLPQPRLMDAGIKVGMGAGPGPTNSSPEAGARGSADADADAARDRGGTERVCVSGSANWSGQLCTGSTDTVRAPCCGRTS